MSRTYWTLSNESLLWLAPWKRVVQGWGHFTVNSWWCEKDEGTILETCSTDPTVLSTFEIKIHPYGPPSETNEDENMDANEEFTIDWEAQIDIEINDDNRNDPSTYTPLLLRQKMYEDLIQENGGDNDVRATRFVEARDALVNLMSQTTGTNFDLDKTLDGIWEAYGGLEAVGINYNARTGNLRVGTLVRGKK